MSDASRLLWAANVRTHSFQDRLAAARAYGYDALSLFPIDVRQWESDGLAPEDLRRLAAEADVEIAVLDPLTSWLPGWSVPDALGDDFAAFIDFGEDTFFDLAERLGVGSVNVIEALGDDVDPDHAVHHFGRVCDRAAALGMRAQIEFMPFSGVPDLAFAWDVVRRAGRPNGGLTFDTWHYHRGTVDDALLRSIPGERVFRVQVADAASEPVGDLMNDLLHHRLLPGHGALPLAATLRSLRATGALASVGPELFSDALDTLSADEAAAATGSALDDLLASSLP